jgi:hypothetical protein
MNKTIETIKKGVWFYDNIIEIPVSIIKQNWDYYFEEGYTEGEPHLNSEGFAFYVVGNDNASRSETFYTIGVANNV